LAKEPLLLTRFHEAIPESVAPKVCARNDNPHRLNPGVKDAVPEVGTDHDA
jgi:hypothetical protein